MGRLYGLVPAMGAVQAKRGELKRDLRCPYGPAAPWGAKRGGLWALSARPCGPLACPRATSIKVGNAVGGAGCSIREAVCRGSGVGGFFRGGRCGLPVYGVCADVEGRRARVGSCLSVGARFGRGSSVPCPYGPLVRRVL